MQSLGHGISDIVSPQQHSYYYIFYPISFYTAPALAQGFSSHLVIASSLRAGPSSTEKGSHHANLSISWIGLLVSILIPYIRIIYPHSLPYNFAGPPTVDGVYSLTPLIFFCFFLIVIKYTKFTTFSFTRHLLILAANSFHLHPSLENCHWLNMLSQLIARD